MLIPHGPFPGRLTQHESEGFAATLPVISAKIEHAVDRVDEDSTSDSLITLFLFHARIQQQKFGAACLHVMGKGEPQEGAPEGTHVIACGVV